MRGLFGPALNRPKRLVAAEGLCRPEPAMTLPRSAADVLAQHVTLEIECIDRMYLNVYQSRLQHVGGVVSFLRHHRGHPFASSALLEPISQRFIAGLYSFAKDQGVAVIDFAKGQRKDEVAHEFLAEFDQPEGVLFVGRAQEKTAVFRTEKRRNPITGATYPWIVRTTAMVNQFYIYAVDADFGPFFIKFCSYFPVRHEAPFDRVGCRAPPAACRSRPLKLEAA